MPYAHRLQSSRFELKYVIHPNLVRPLREFASSYLEPDEHADPKENWEYPVHSLYLDSPTLALARATIQGHKNRFKLRIRFYDFKGDSPVFFEIKRRVSDVILKQRANVKRSAVAPLLAGQQPCPGHMTKATADETEYGALQEFCSLRDMLHADGQAFVSYKREAYVTPNDNSVRMTFDREISGTPYRRTIDLGQTHGTVYPKVDGVVLELKFTDRFPNWLRQMVEVFDLERTSMAKYVTCVRELGNTPAHLLAYSQETRL
jgi:hypothetical protein